MAMGFIIYFFFSFADCSNLIGLAFLAHREVVASKPAPGALSFIEKMLSFFILV